ncbi:4-hydroxybenzoate octaprenyltransferase [Oceanococcus atlanticus]|uniref:4-hydroxybenzoate octaprenyltransferase n=1 Tax=Oceanococcus atlanticus TaxID=1317117 RepID=A0A1Y1SAX8_9GAMM|nr:4-hydroxybenzoate octaprenyltransferase [Oceanococcus atlanticus]ORE85567.1 4-hydroxybenzoate octaprenyltransferase [Oceanococcus atlanticus]
MQRLNAYYRLVRLDRPIGNMLLLWPTLWGLWVAADGLPPWNILAIFVLGTFLMRAAGCAINDFADRKIDPHVKRTDQRPLAAGEIQAWEAVMVFVVLALVAFGLALQLNRLALLLSIPAVILAGSYPFAKRYTYLPQAHLGMAFAAGIPMGFAALTGQVPALAWLLVLITLLWTIVYDTFYAMVDRDDDLKIGVKSTAVLFGRHDRLITGLLQLAVIGLLVVLGCWKGYGLWFYLGVAVGAGHFVWQQFLIRERQREPCFQAFLNNHRFGMAIFAGLLLQTL